MLSPAEACTLPANRALRLICLAGHSVRTAPYSIKGKSHTQGKCREIGGGAAAGAAIGAVAGAVIGVAA